MKKLLVLLLALCLIFSFTACSQSETQNEVAEAEDELNEALENADDLDDITDAFDDYTDKAEDAGATTDMSAEDIVELLTEDSSYATQVETYKSQGILYKIEARDNSIAYVCQYTMDIGDTAAVKETIDAQEASFESMADSLFKLYTGIDGVIIEYLDYNGDIITAFEF